ncbi:ABC transporter, ATP-binding protein [Roseobacter sp. SK209-2-6]|uniref:ABC transporter ATP-binding protein n=1 Tax=Roseobacter sp. SK209-2-6 TaxID=388739 RepID=UPI0000F3F7F6|nr:ABC transporter ATP-binding protein [Roseobacter sp. SK209-2-6]EBA17930.1 ABC transporter, ATP-binding protein [Roseobacter sp. SK209-2-6]
MLLKVRNLGKTISGPSGRTTILNGINLDLDAGASLALTGESGSGKSTLLHLIAALDGFDAGEIEVAGNRLSRANEGKRAHLRRTIVSVVFQQFNIIPSLNVQDNIALHAGLGSKSDPAWEHHLIDKLGLRDHLHHFPEQLSGGQQQRVAIGRAMAMRPKLLLADEPTGNLDEASAQSVLDLMLDLVKESETALFLVTHSLEIAKRLDHQIQLKGGVLQ